VARRWAVITDKDIERVEARLVKVYDDPDDAEAERDYLSKIAPMTEFAAQVDVLTPARPYSRRRRPPRPDGSAPLRPGE
jgi:hypothetical protein